MRPFFSSQAAATKGSYNLAGIAESRHRCADREDHRRQQPRRPDDRLPRLRPGVPRRALLGAAMVPRPRHPIAYWDVFAHPAKPPRYAQGVGAPENWWYRRRQGRQGRAGEIIHERLYRPPHFADDPDAVRNPVRVLRRRAVRAGRPGRARDRAAYAAPTPAAPRAFPARPAAISARAARSARPATPSIRNTAARRGSIPISSRAWKSSSASTSRRRSAFALMVWNFARFDFGKSYFRDVSVLQLIKEKLPVSMSLGIWMTLLTYLISIPLGIRKAVKDGSQFDTWTSAVDHRRLCDSRLPVRDPADHPVCRRLVPQHLPAARADLGRLVAISLVLEDHRLFLAPHAAADLDGARARSPP